ncbi:MAG: hypothetical protein R2701_06425 [Acidimicrobiales bacterium]
MAKPEDVHEWVSFADPDEDRTWIFDVTFLTSNWSCIFGRGCKGVLTEDFSDAVQGCCSYGAHVTGSDDVAHIEATAGRLTASQWQFRDVGMAEGIFQLNDDGETTTLLHDDACVFLNRPGFDGDGLGCAFHHLAEAEGSLPRGRHAGGLLARAPSTGRRDRRPRARDVHDPRVEAPRLGRGRPRLPLVVHRVPGGLRWAPAGVPRARGGAHRAGGQGGVPLVAASTSIAVFAATAPRCSSPTQPCDPERSQRNESMKATSAASWASVTSMVGIDAV